MKSEGTHSKGSGDGKAPKRAYDLEERTARFGEQAVDFAKSLRLTPITESLVTQLVRSGTSVGANYCEASDAGTKKEFRHRMSLCRREAKESKHWLRMLARADPERAEQAKALWREAHELTLIFAAITRRTET